MHNNSSHSPRKTSTQPWMLSSPDRGPEPYNYSMASRPPGSVLPIPQQHHYHHSPSSQQPLPYHPPPPPPPPPPQQQQQQQQRQLHHEDRSISPPIQMLDSDYSKSQQKNSTRSVIPSKRAAQNRAAQKAFRQRREQYIKDLELKAKEMEDWQEEMDKLRRENGELRERIVTLENQVAILTGGDATKIPEIGTNKSDTPPKENEKQSPSTIPAKHSLHEPLEHGPTEDSRGKSQEGSFAPIPLRAPHHTGYESQPYHSNKQNTETTLTENDTTSDENNKRRKTLEDPLLNPTQHIGQAPNHITNNPPIILQPQQELSNLQHPFWNQNNPNTIPDLAGMPPPSAMGDFDLDFDFDPFFEEEFGPTLTNTNDFLPNANSGQVLDDLFAMLQTRQRPQIPMVPAEDNSELVGLNENVGKSV